MAVGWAIIGIGKLADVTIAPAITRQPDSRLVAVATCRLDNGALATLSSIQVLGGTPRHWLAVGEGGWLEGRGAVGASAGDDVVLHDGGASALAP